MVHVPLVVYIVVELGGVWVAVGAILLHRRDPSRRLYYFGLFIGSVMVLQLAEIGSAYCTINQVSTAAWVSVAIRILYAAGELLQFYVVIPLAFAVANLRMPARIRRLHLGLLLLYAAATGFLAATRSTFELTHVALGAAHLAAVGIIWTNRHRITNPRIRLFVYHMITVTAVFAPLIGISIYSGIAEHLPLNAMTVQVLYALAAEVVTAVHATRTFFVPRNQGGSDSAEQRPAKPRSVHPRASSVELSVREREIADLVAKGYTNKEIARLLFISHKTVTNHLYHAYRKLGVTNRVQLLTELSGFHRRSPSPEPAEGNALAFPLPWTPDRTLLAQRDGPHSAHSRNVGRP